MRKGWAAFSFALHWLGSDAGDTKGGRSSAWPVAAMLVPAAYLSVSWLGGDDHASPYGADVPVYTLEELQGFDGNSHYRNRGDLLLAVWGRVFNVSTGSEFYGPGAGYRCFAGTDSTWALAKTKRGKKFTNRPLDTLSEKDLGHLNRSYWSTYRHKYPVVGVLLDPPYDPKLYDVYAGTFDLVASEVHAGLQQLKSASMSGDEKLRLIFEKFDLDADGHLQLSEFHELENVTKSADSSWQPQTTEGFRKLLARLDPKSTETEAGMSFAAFAQGYKLDGAEAEKRIASDFGRVFPDFAADLKWSEEDEGRRPKGKCPMRKVARAVGDAIRNVLPSFLLE